MLKDSPLYTILSGFSFCDTPGIGTFYDFFSRIWQDGRNTLSPNGRFPKMRLPKGKKTRHSTHYVQYLCPFLGIFFSCTIFSCQFPVTFQLFRTDALLVCCDFSLLETDGEHIERKLRGN